ncbi:helix-turn-helix domain-containing protein [Amycolatopsis sp. H20-H5]|uniref:helix-turn-helix domain-containing protein n=1 Tax=Amycolatopsis sp. H20-H5 TaxID=3046309 RepID=UPI002DBBEAE2|nr:helix-turn-helix transcriptional regulator [Amycolatopsis sp. H20-H5]MEC3976219.1 helix-turn-helix transcriptional regulator [Amycolatopsis sp. H20-H5]
MAHEPDELVARRGLLGQQLAAYRSAAGLTQGQLAQAVNLDRTTISHIEKGRTRADKRFWRIADERCKASGDLLAGFAALEVAKQNYDLQNRETELSEARAKAERLAEVISPSLIVPTLPEVATPWETTDVIRRLYRSDVGSETLEQLHMVTEDLCCEYAWRDGDELKADANHWLQYISGLLTGSCTLKEHRELLVISGWLVLLIGCIEYDLGRKRQAGLSRAAAFRIGQETGHGEIMAWSFEMSAWFALTQGDLAAVADFSEAGSKAAPNTSVVVQLAAQSAKAAARMGQPEAVRRILDNGYRLLGQHEHPSRPENHFIIDPQKWDFYAMDCYRIVGEDARAAEHAHEVLRISRRPDGTDKSPMRATEARLTLAMTAMRQGDLDSAADWTRQALSASRKSADQLVMVAAEVQQETKRLFPKDPATHAITEPIAQALAELRWTN